jgi:hypothetical protein
MIAEVLYYVLMSADLFATIGAPITIGIIWTLRTFLRKTSLRELICLAAYWSVVAGVYAALAPLLLRLAAAC